MKSVDFWNKIFTEASDRSRIEMPDLTSSLLQAALTHFGDVRNKVVIDLGCGNGSASLFFAYHGARVLSVDYSEQAIGNFRQFCADHSISNIEPVCLPAQRIGTLGRVDYIYGSEILHHIEPFDEFARTLRDTVTPGGRLFFQENNAQSRIMVWFRRHLVGRLWVPKYGDAEEFPLMPSEIGQLARHFHVRIEYPELVYFRMMSKYLFRGQLMALCQSADSYCYRFRWLRKYSYKQYLFLS